MGIIHDDVVSPLTALVLLPVYSSASAAAASFLGQKSNRDIILARIRPPSTVLLYYSTQKRKPDHTL